MLNIDKHNILCYDEYVIIYDISMGWHHKGIVLF